MEGKEDYYSQLLLKRCIRDRKPLLFKMEDKYKARAIVESKLVGEDQWIFGEYTNYHNYCQPQSDEW